MTLKALCPIFWSLHLDGYKIKPIISQTHKDKQQF